MSEKPGIAPPKNLSSDLPKSPKILFHDMIAVALGEHGAINHVIDDSGEATSIHPRVTPKVTDFP